MCSPRRSPSRLAQETATAAASDLAERILDVISSAEQNWAAVEHMANALADVAARAARTATGDEPSARRPP